MKEIKITKIKELIAEWGSTSVQEIGLSSCPVYTVAHKDDVCLVEHFNLNDVLVINYIHDMECNSFNVLYEDLNEDVLDEILDILVDHYGYIQSMLDASVDEPTKIKNN